MLHGMVDARTPDLDNTLFHIIHNDSQRAANGVADSLRFVRNQIYRAAYFRKIARLISI